jgi:hypothetical protein
VHTAAFRTYRRGGHDRELVGADYLDSGRNSMPGGGAVDHDDSHDPLLYPITTNRAQNLGDDVAGFRMGDLLKSGLSPPLPIA